MSTLTSNELAEALSYEGQKDAWLDDLLTYLHFDPVTNSHPDWVARAQAAEAELAKLKAPGNETSEPLCSNPPPTMDEALGLIVDAHELTKGTPLYLRFSLFRLAFPPGARGTRPTQKAGERRCPHCNDTGWTETPDTYTDGSVATSRRCPRGCDDSLGKGAGGC